MKTNLEVATARDCHESRGKRAVFIVVLLRKRPDPVSKHFEDHTWQIFWRACATSNISRAFGEDPRQGQPVLYPPKVPQSYCFYSLTRFCLSSIVKQVATMAPSPRPKGDILETTFIRHVNFISTFMGEPSHRGLSNN